MRAVVRSVDAARLQAGRAAPAARRRGTAVVTVRCNANPGGGSFRKNRIVPPKPGDGLPVTEKEALIKTLDEVSKSQGRVSDRTNVVLGGEDSSVENWRQLDQKVNEYPCQRSFKCVGLAEEDFKDSMVAAVADVVGSVHPEQVLDIFANLKKDKRLKWAM